MGRRRRVAVIQSIHPETTSSISGSILEWGISLGATLSREVRCQRGLTNLYAFIIIKGGERRGGRDKMAQLLAPARSVKANLGLFFYVG